jgi:hypothetical protein
MVETPLNTVQSVFNGVSVISNQPLYTTPQWEFLPNTIWYRKYRELRHVSPRSRNDDIGEDEAVVTRENPIVRKRRLDKDAFRLPAGVK